MTGSNNALSTVGMQMQRQKSLVQQSERQVKTAAPLIINFTCEFNGNFVQSHKGKLYLVIQLYEQALSSVNLPIENKFNVVAFTAFELVDAMNINTGIFTLQLYNAPVVIPCPLSEVLPATITFTINGNFSQPITQPPKAVSSSLYIPNEGRPMLVDAKAGQGFRFTINGMRFIPEICGPIKVNLYGYCSGTQEFCQSHIMFPDCSSTVSMPVYKDEWIVVLKKIDPTSIILGILEVYDENEDSRKIFASFFINLFADPITYTPIRDSNATNYKLIEGHFQLPLRYEYCFSSPFTAEALTQLDRIPCSSILVTINKFFPKRSIKYEDPPSYETGVYLNDMNVTTEELELMNRLKVKPSRTIRDVIDSYRKLKGSTMRMVIVFC
jgi:hypothetical protein